MTTNNNGLSRRSFLKSLVVAAAALPVLGAFRGSYAKGKTPGNLPAGAKEADFNDMMVKNLKYSHDAKDVWKAEGKSKNCASCAFYTASNSDWGKCTLFASQQGLVYKDGSCMSYNKKA